ncbi:response regulator receiver protein [Burkholderia plantarii]|uniref:Response regulator receiver protein n=2 Tax=Burkholderia plantarii TaxID=41899 RepID=A0A0B6RU17_BURPL|nr:response regulator receiver protein [Burkholderia plantarii]
MAGLTQQSRHESNHRGVIKLHRDQSPWIGIVEMNKAAGNILLVEDSPLDAELTETALWSIGMHNPLVTVGDGEAALDYLLRRGAWSERAPGNPDFVLLDQGLPKLDGFAVLAAIRAEPALDSLPVIMLTGSTSEHDLNRCFELGADAYIVKPLKLSNFLAAVECVNGKLQLPSQLFPAFFGGSAA